MLEGRTDTMLYRVKLRAASAHMLGTLAVVLCLGTICATLVGCALSPGGGSEAVDAHSTETVKLTPSVQPVPGSTATVGSEAADGHSAETVRLTPSGQPAPDASATLGFDATDEPRIEILNLTPAEQLTPDDVLRQVVFYVPGGGDASLCPGPRDYPEVISLSAVGAWEANAELGDTLYAESCGWKQDEVVRMSIRTPAGGQIAYAPQVGEVNAGDDWYYETPLWFKHEIALDDPLGTYTVVFEGESGVAKRSIEVVEPSGPRLYIEQDNSLYLYNFEPGERVRVLAYARGPAGDYLNAAVTLVGWAEARTGTGGQVRLVLEGVVADDAQWVVVGDASGEVEPFRSYGYLPSILSYDVVARNESAGVELREGPGATYTSVATLAPNTRMRVLEEVGEGASPAEGGNGYTEWLHVRLGDGTEGWVDREQVESVKD